MSQIITVTLAPTLDRTLFVHHLAAGYPNTVTEATRLDPAGPGVNISRALASMGVDTQAIVLLGDDAIARAYRALIEEESFPTLFVRRSGRTRSNTIIYDSGTRHETQIIEEEANLDDEHTIAEHIKATISDVTHAGDTICLAGPLPYGLPNTLYSEIIEIVRAKEAKVVLAASGIALEVAIKSQPNIIAMAQSGLEAFFNFPVRSQEDVVYSARKMSDRSGGSTVLVSHQEMAYAVLVTSDKIRSVQIANLSDDSEGTSSGVKDAFLAGFLARYRTQSEAADVLKWAMASALFTRLRPGNEFGSADEITPYLDQIELTETGINADSDG